IIIKNQKCMNKKTSVLLIAGFYTHEREKAVDELHVNSWNIVRPDAKTSHNGKDRNVKPLASDTQEYAPFHRHGGKNRCSAKTYVFGNRAFGLDHIADP